MLEVGDRVRVVDYSGEYGHFTENKVGTLVSISYRVYTVKFDKYDDRLHDGCGYYEGERGYHWNFGKGDLELETLSNKEKLKRGLLQEV